MYHAFDHYGPRLEGSLAERNNGVMISMSAGKALAYALFNLQERGDYSSAMGLGFMRAWSLAFTQDPMIWW